MTWSLALQNGDLSLSGSNLGIVTSESKLTQDLTCYVLTALGSDPAHPDYGSIIQGGIDGSGTLYQSFLDGLNDSATATRLIAELQRITLAYQNMQLIRAQADQNNYGKTTLTKGEVLLSVDQIVADLVEATVNLIVQITTAANTNVSVTVPVT